MAPKKQVEGPYEVMVVYTTKDGKKSRNIMITADTTFQGLTEICRDVLQVPEDMDCMLRHNGHKMAASSKIGGKSPLELQQFGKTLTISRSLTFDQLMMHTAPALADFAVGLNLKISKSASKGDIAAAICGSPPISSSAIVVQLRLPDNSLVPVEVKAGDIVDISKFLSKPTESEQQVQHKQSINKQSTNKQTNRPVTTRRRSSSRSS